MPAQCVGDRKVDHTHRALRGCSKLVSNTKEGKPVHVSTSYVQAAASLSFTAASRGRCCCPHFTDETPEPVVTRPSQGRAGCSQAPPPTLATTVSTCPSSAGLLSACQALFQELDTLPGRPAQSHPVGTPSPGDEVGSAPATRTRPGGAGPGPEPAASTVRMVCPCTQPAPARAPGSSGEGRLGPHMGPVGKVDLPCRAGGSRMQFPP